MSPTAESPTDDRCPSEPLQARAVRAHEVDVQYDARVAPERVEAWAARLRTMDAERATQLADRVRSLHPLEGGVAAKFHDARRWDLRRLLGWSPGRREWTAARALEAEGVRAVRALAWMRFPSGREAVLLGWHDDVEPLTQPSAATRVRAGALGALVRTLHDAGWRHRDLHAGNILVHDDGTARLADFHRARRGASSRARLRDLCDFGHAFLTRSSPLELARFARGYDAADALTPAQRRARTRSRRAAATRSLRRFLRHFDQRSDGSGRHFTRWRRSGWSGIRVRHTAVHEADLIAKLATVASDDAVHRTASGAVWRWPTSDGVWAIKRSYERGFLGAIKRLGRGPRAHRAWRSLHQLARADLPAPSAVACATRGGRFRAHASDLITEFVEGTLLAEVLRGPDGARRRRVLEELPRQVARLHDGFLAHRDLKAENFLVSNDGSLTWIDFDGVRAVRRLTLHRAAKDLMRLNASFLPGDGVRATERLRFLRRYLAARRLSSPPCAPLARAIVRLTERKWQRRRPPLSSGSSVAR